MRVLIADDHSLFRDGLEQLVGDGTSLSAELATLFDECVTDGF